MSEFLDNLATVWPRFVDGFWVTVQLSVGGALVGFVVAVVLGIAASTGTAWLTGPARVIIEFFRGTSLVVQLFFIFYVIPTVTGYDIGSLGTGILAFGLNYGAYGAEVVRGSLKAVPKGQWETTTALSMSYPTALRRVIWPQAWALMLPGLNNLAVMLVKGTALASLILLTDITEVADRARRTMSTYEAFGVAAVLYLAIALAFSAFLRWLEVRAHRKLGRGKRAPQTTEDAEAPGTGAAMQGVNA